MIVTEYVNKDIYDKEGEFEISKYFGSSAYNITDRDDINNWISSILGKQVITQDKKIGICIGIEINQQYHDIYSIVMLDDTKELVFDLHTKAI